MPSSPRGRGRIERLVVRKAGERKELPDRIVLDPVEGVVGDRWDPSAGKPLDTQVSLVNTRILDAMRGERAPELCGDNVHVDLDLSEAALPEGARLECGDVVLEVGTIPHTGCEKFVARYGARAMKRIARGDRMGRRARGVLCRVVSGGELAVGDELVVRPPDGH